MVGCIPWRPRKCLFSRWFSVYKNWGITRFVYERVTTNNHLEKSYNYLGHQSDGFNGFRRLDTQENCHCQTLGISSPKTYLNHSKPILISFGWVSPKRTPGSVPSKRQCRGFSQLTSFAVSAAHIWSYGPSYTSYKYWTKPIYRIPSGELTQQLKMTIDSGISH